jgi:hypothetical protein
MASMNYFDSSRKKSNLYFEVEIRIGNACKNKNPLTFMFTVVFLHG